MIRLLLCMLMLFSTAAHAEPGTVYLRGGRIFEADVVTPSQQSLVAVVDGERLEYGWHQIADVRGQAAGLVREYLTDAETAWRGLSRLERGDVVAAEPLLERAFAKYGTQVGPTSEAVATGLLTCRVARGAQALAVEPFLCVLLNSSGVSQSEALDENLKLYQSLPPIWSTDSGLTNMASRIATDNFAAWNGDRRTRQLAELYVTAAVFQINGKAPLPDFEPADDGVRFVYEIVASRIGDAPIREQFRGALKLRSERNIPKWQRAWIHAAVGNSLLRESDNRSSRLGIVELLHVPALYHQNQPFLAGVCLSRSALTLDRMSREDEAILLATEFQRVYRTHDAAQSPEMKQLIRKANERIAAQNTNEEDA